MNLTAVEIVRAAGHLAVIAGGATAVGVWAADRAAGPSRLDRALVWAVAAVGHVVAIALVLGAVGLLRPVPAVVLAGATGLLAWRSRRRLGSRDLSPWQPSGATIVLLGLATAYLALGLTVGLRSGQSQHHETRHYHYEAVAHFVDDASIWSLPFQNPGLFTTTHPANAELVGSVVAMATDDDQLLYAWLLPASGLLAVLAAAVVARELGAPSWLGGMAGVAVGVVPIVFGIVGHSLANDLLAAAGCAAALALLLTAHRTGATAPVWVAGVALGIALGTKYTALVPAGILCLGAVGLLRPWRRAFAVVPGLAALAGPWLVRNAIATGNPLWPQRVRVAGVEVLEGGTGPLDALSGTLAGHIAAGRWAAVETWMQLVWDLYGPAAVAAVAGTFLGLWIGVRRRNVAMIAVSAFAGAALATYAATPYTGAGTPPAEFLMGSNLRYAMLGVLCGTAALVAVLPRRIAAAGVVVLVAWGAWRLADAPIRTDVGLTAGGVASALLVGGAAVVLAHTVRDRPLRLALPRPLQPIGPELAAVALVTAVVLATTATDGAAPARPLEQAVATIAAGDREVLVVGETDLRSIIGPTFERRPIAPADDVIHSTYADPLDLTAAVDAAAPAVLVVDHAHFGVPDGFAPSADWCERARLGTTAIYSRQPGRACPSGPGDG